MKTFSTILIGALLLVHQTTCADVPNVKSTECSETSLSPNFEECLTITMNEETLGLVGLVDVYNYGEVLEGSLYSEDGEEIEETHVSVTKGDGEQEAHVIILIMENDDQLVYEMDCDLTTGTCKDHPVFMDGQLVDEVMEVPESDRPNNEDNNEEGEEEEEERQRKTLPPNGFKLRVQVLYDTAFAGKFNGDGVQIKKAIDRILVHTNSYYKLKSLTTKIDLDTTGLPYTAVDKTYTATGNNLNLLRPYINSFSKDADSYTLLSFENNLGGTVGIAWKGTTCMPRYNRGYRVNINEYMNDDITTAAVVAHEIGHNLGMAHDFGTEAGGFRNTDVIRYSSSGSKCSKVEGIMDYYGKTTKWSPCSVEDFTNYYNSVNPWCLTELSGTKKRPDPVPKPQPPAPTCKDDFPLYCNRITCIFSPQSCKKSCNLC